MSQYFVHHVYLSGCAQLEHLMAFSCCVSKFAAAHKCLAIAFQCLIDYAGLRPFSQDVQSILNGLQECRDQLSSLTLFVKHDLDYLTVAQLMVERGFSVINLSLETLLMLI